MSELVLRSRRVLLPDGEAPAALRIVDGVITQILPYGSTGDAAEPQP